MSTRIALVVGIGMVVAGFVLGLMPAGGDCGNAFASTPDPDVGGCSALLAQARQLPIALLIVGFVLGIGAVAEASVSSPEHGSAPGDSGSAPS